MLEGPHARVAGGIDVHQLQDLLLGPAKLPADDLLAAVPIQRAWRRLTRGDDNAALGMWAVLMFQQWRTRWAA